ncbi:ATP-binding protein [Actinosynnema sp. NPDC023658]|uniref:ATP-binding protein n=1 Tax=Actinosynnema sp. NPDC023658 TaxID=3155465 RepID=UPI0033FAB4E4
MTENPYRNVGQRVLGDAFVGRTELLWRVRSTWEGDVLGNLSVQGSHRMGKTSLVGRAVELDRGNRPDLVFISASVGDYESGPDLFRALVRKAHSEVVQSPGPARPYLPLLDQSLGSVSTTDDVATLRDQVSEYFGHLGRAGLSTVVVLDEFDRASAVLTRLSEFQFLRSLASERPAVGLVTISRRPIHVIEIDAVSGSTLDAVLSLRCDVGCFTDDEIDQMLDKVKPHGIDLGAHRADVVKFTGGHPYLLALLCHEVVQQYRQRGGIDVDAAYRGLTNQFETQFATLVRGLDTSTGDRAGFLLHKVVAKATDAVPAPDLDLMERLGLIQKDGTSFRLFSPEFERYVRRAIPSP